MVVSKRNQRALIPPNNLELTSLNHADLKERFARVSRERAREGRRRRREEGREEGREDRSKTLAAARLD